MKSIENQNNTPENQQLNTVVQNGIESALTTIKQRFENTPDGELDYHNTHHTKQVIGRVEKISQALGLDEKTTGLAKLNAAFHDTIQRGYATFDAEDDSKTGMFKRFTGGNEGESFTELEQFLRSDEVEGIFTEDDITSSKLAIEGTIPGFDPEKGAITQPNISEKSGEIALALAMADLGAGGMEGAESLLYDGDANFREEHMKWSHELRRAVEETRSLDGIDESTQDAIRKKMIGWTKFQKKILSDQRDFFQERIQWLSERGTDQDTIQKLQEVFPTFQSEESFAAEIQSLDEKIAERKSMDFESLVRDMYPDIDTKIKQATQEIDEMNITAQDEESARLLLEKILNNK